MRDAAVIDVLQDLVAEAPRRGFWRYYDRMRLDGHRWNHKRVHRVYCALPLNLPRRTKRRVPPRFGQTRLAPTRLNDIWAIDFMHDALYGGRRFRTFNVLDEGNREGLAIEVGVDTRDTANLELPSQFFEGGVSWLHRPSLSRQADNPGRALERGGHRGSSVTR